MPPKKSVNRICLTILQIIWVITAAKVYKKAGSKVILSQLLGKISVRQQIGLSLYCPESGRTFGGLEHQEVESSWEALGGNLESLAAAMRAAGHHHAL